MKPRLRVYFGVAGLSSAAPRTPARHPRSGARPAPSRPPRQAAAGRRGLGDAGVAGATERRRQPHAIRTEMRAALRRRCERHDCLRTPTIGERARRGRSRPSEQELQSQLVDAPGRALSDHAEAGRRRRWSTGALNCVWLNALNDSNRNCSRVPLRQLEVLEQRQIEVVDARRRAACCARCCRSCPAPAARTRRC